MFAFNPFCTSIDADAHTLPSDAGLRHGSRNPMRICIIELDNGNARGCGSANLQAHSDPRRAAHAAGESSGLPCERCAPDLSLSHADSRAQPAELHVPSRAADRDIGRCEEQTFTRPRNPAKMQYDRLKSSCGVMKSRAAKRCKCKHSGHPGYAAVFPALSTFAKSTNLGVGESPAYRLCIGTKNWRGGASPMSNQNTRRPSEGTNGVSAWHHATDDQERFLEEAALGPMAEAFPGRKW